MNTLKNSTPVKIALVSSAIFFIVLGIAKLDGVQKTNQLQKSVDQYNSFVK